MSWIRHELRGSVRPPSAVDVSFPLAVLFAVLAFLASAPISVQAQDVAETHAEATIVDGVTGAPVAGVRVSAGARVAHTDAQGRFHIHVPPETRRLEFRRLGYGTLEVTVHDLPREIGLVPQPLLLGTLSIVSSRRPALAEGTSLAVETVGADRLHHRGATSTAEGLESIQGVSLQRTGSWGARPVVRGLGGERVTVLLDGARSSQACVFGMDQGLATVDPASVERIEVLQGPGSALYGSGNLGGVINVVSRRPPRGQDGWGEARIAASSGVPGGTAGASIGSRHGSAWVAASGDVTAYSDYRSGDGRVDGTGFRQATAELKAGIDPSSHHIVDLQAQVYEGRDIGWPMHGEAEIPRESRRSFALDWGWQRSGWLDGLSTRAYIQRLDHEMWSRMAMHGGANHATMGEMGEPPPNMTVSTTTARSHSTTSGARVQSRLLPLDGVHVDAGFEFTRLGAEATRWTETLSGMGGHGEETTLRSWPAVDIVSGGAFAQGEWRAGQEVALTGGARLDRVRRTAEGWDEAREWIGSGNVGIRAPLPGPLALRSSVGWGYRTPDATELFGLALRPDGFVYRGDPSVRTERGRNTEVSVALETDRLSGSATLFRNDLSDLIVPIPVHGEEISGRPVRRYDNVNRARIQGITAALGVERERWSGETSVGYLRGTDRRTGTTLPQLPPLEGTVAVTRRVVPASGWIQLELAGALRQERVARELNEPETPGYGIVSLRGGFRVGDAAVVLGLENLTDRAYRAHLDPMSLLRPGRNLHVRVTRRF